jgi:hypothetical protein
MEGWLVADVAEAGCENVDERPARRRQGGDFIAPEAGAIEQNETQGQGEQGDACPPGPDAARRA